MSETTAEQPRVVHVAVQLRGLLIIVAVALGVWAFASIADAVLLVFIGVFLAFVFEFPLRALMAKTHLGRGLAATIVVLGTALLLTVLGLVLLAPLVGDLRDFLKASPSLVDQLRGQDGLHWLGNSGAAANIQHGAQNASSKVPDDLSKLLGVAGDVFSLALGIFTVVFVALFVLVDMPHIKTAVKSVLAPGSAEIADDLWERITVTVSRWAIGAGTIAIIAGTVQGTTAWLLGSSYALALGLIAGFLDLIPNLGATIAGFILVPAVWAQSGTTAALIMLAVVLIYQQIENNLLTPTIQRKATNIWASLVIISVTLFGALLGVFGALVAVPLTGSIQIVVQEFTKTRRARVAELRAAAEPAGSPVDVEA